MLSIAKCCTRLAPRSSALKNGFSNIHVYRTTPNIPGIALLQRNPNQLAKAQGFFRKTGTLSVRYASKLEQKSQKIVGSWMFTCSGMVFIAVALGGVTRLTESGLSMVTWKFLGEKMPTTEDQWIEEFERYKAFPEYKISNSGMTLEEFKRIWWMEYLHRMWGRLIGASFALPAAYFWRRGMLTQATKHRVLVLGSLIGLQGLMGWYMVKSGLEDRFDGPADVPRVSQYRLAAHLGLALVIYSGFVYGALDHLLPAKRPFVDYFGQRTIKSEATEALKKFRRIVYGTKGLIFLTALSGAFVAGLDAGLIYNTFPRMAKRWIPNDILALSPAMRNFTENPTTVQFNHRLLGTSTVFMITWMAWKSRKHNLPGRGFTAVLAVLCAGYVQVILGITTLVNHVPVPLAASHQSGSLVLLSTILWLCHELKYVKRIVK